LSRARALGCHPEELYFEGKREGELVRLFPGHKIFEYEMLAELEQEGWKLEADWFVGHLAKDVLKIFNGPVES
jgi:hypothetical protein